MKYNNYTAEHPNAPTPTSYMSKFKCRHCGYYYGSAKDLELHKRIVKQRAEGSFVKSSLFGDR